MANDLRVTITAVDKATATVNKINQSMNGALAPMRGMKKLGGELAKNPAIDGLRKMSGAAGVVAKNLGIASGSMLGLSGLGIIAGLSAVTAQWARMGREIGNTTASLGTSTKGLTSMRGAAQLAGLSAESMDGGLESVRQTMQDARWGRNPPLIALMNKLGIAFKYTKSGSIDAIASLKDISEAMSRQTDVGAKHTIAQAFGVESLFPLLNKGKDAIEAYQREVEKLGGTPTDGQITRAEKFAAAIEKMKIAADGIKRNVGDNISGMLLPAIDGSNDFLAKYGDKISYVISGLIGDFIGTGDPNAPSKGRSGSGIIKQLPVAAGAPMGIRSNNPTNLMPGGREAVFGSMEDGIRAAMRNLMGKNYFGGGNDTVAGIISKWSPANAAGNSATKTANYISAVSGDVGGGHLNPNDPATMAKLLSAMIRQENGAGTYDVAKMDDTIKHIVVEFKNAPPGTTATARNASGNQVPVRIATAMPVMGVP